MDNTKEYQTDARYYLALARSMIDDLYNHAKVIEDKSEELDKVSTEESSSLADSLKELWEIRAKEREFKYTIVQAEKDFELILINLNKADKLDPNARLKEYSSNDLRALAYMTVGYCYMRASELTQALLAFERSHNLKPNQEALSSYALALQLKGGWGSKTKILEALQKVVEFDPYSKLGLEAAKKIARM